VRRRAASLALAAASLAVALLVAEGLVRLFSPIGPALLVTDPVAGKRYRPGFEGPVFVDEAEREVAVRVNALGFRGPEWPRRKPAGGLRVAVLGDSMTAAVATEEEQTFVRRLQAALAADPRRPVEVANFGVASASTGSELVTWRGVVAEYDPDLVLLAFFTGNDLADNSRRLTSAARPYFDVDGAGRLHQVEDPAPTPVLVRWLDRHSRLYVWQKVAFRRLRALGRYASSGIEPGQRIFVRGSDPAVEHAWRVTEALFVRLRDEVEARGARFAVVVIPCAEQVDDALWRDLARRGRDAGLVLDRGEPSRRLAAVFAREGLAALDLTPAFDEAAARGPLGVASAAGLYLFGRFHLSDEGHRVAADAILAFLREGDGRRLLTPR
jgi:lysophospholipase L1-like esterase